MRTYSTFGIAVDITRACNLDCTHCYLEKKQNHDLSDEQWHERIDELKKERPFLLHAIWLWGEPLLRKKLLIELMGKFRYNSIFTNGTIPFSGIPKNSVLQISIDGTEKIHDHIRWVGSFWKTVENIRKHPGRTYTLATTINALNRSCLRELIEYFHAFSPRISGMHFIFHTKLHKTDVLWIDFTQRLEVCRELLALKERYGDFIILTPHMVNHTVSNQKELGKHCPFNRKTIISVDSKGVMKTPCWYGKSLCENCGCSIAYEFSEKNVLDLASMKTMWKLFANSMG